MAGGGRRGGQGSGNGKGHKQATPEQIAELRERLTGLETTVPSVLRYRWFTNDRVLHRFITARNGNVDIALKMLLEHLEWRITYKLDTILDEDLSGTGVSHEFYWSGFDRDGRPCLVFRACEHRKSDSDGASPTVEEKLFKVATPIIENNFPETQHATYVLPCNGMIMMAWKGSAAAARRFMFLLGEKVISSFIDPGTADKIRLCKDFDDPALVKAFSPETLKAFIAVKPSMAPPQPYVAPDPLANPSPPSKSSASFLSNNINKVNDDNALPSSDTLEDDSHAGGEGQGHPAQQSRHSAATTLAAAAAAAAAPVANGGGDDGNRSSSGVSLPPPSPGGSTAYGGGGGAPSPSGSQVPRPEAAGMLQPGLSPAGAAAAVQRRASLAAAAGEAPPSPSGSNAGQHPAAPPSPAGDSLYATSMTGGVEGGESTGGGGGGGRGGEGESNNVFDERFISKSSASHAGGHVNGYNFGGGDKLDSSSKRAGSLVSAPQPAAAAAAGPEAATTALPASASGTPRPPVTVQGNGRPLEGAAAAAAAGVAAGRARPPAATAVKGGSGLTGGGGGFGKGYGEEVQRATSRTLEVTERTGVLYKRRDTLRGRFAYRQQYAVLRFEPPEAASLSSLRRESGFGGVPLRPPPPTLTLLKGRGKSETGKVMSLEGAEVTLGTAMAGNLYPFVISFPSTAPAPTTISPTRSHRNRPPPTQQQRLPPRRNTEDYMFTGVLDAASAAAASSPPTGNGDGDDPSSCGDGRQHQHVVLGTAAAAAAAGDGGGGGGGGGNTPSGPMTTASSSTVTSPYVQWRLPIKTTASNASSSSSRMMVRGSSGRKRSDSMGSSSTGGGAVWQRKTLHLACDTEDETLQWARWLADAAALHDAASEAAAAAERRGESGGYGGLQEIAPWRGSTGGGAAAAAARGKLTIAEQEGSSVPPPPPRRRRQEDGDDAELSYRSKYEEALDALAAVSGGEGAGPLPRTREGGNAVVVAGPGGDAPTGKKFRTMLDSYRRSKANNNGNKDSSQEPPPFSSSSSSKPPPPPALRKSGSLRDTFSRRRGSSRSSLSTSTAAGAVLKGLGEAGGALMSMRDSEISRLRRAYARSELSREEMKRCLRALAVQLREGEDRTGALMADREAALCKLSAKEEEFAKKEAVLEEGKARATAEVQQQEELVTSLQVENEALQAALERLRLDFQEERSLRLQSGPAAAAAAAAASKVRPSTPSRLGIFRRRGLTSRDGGGTPAAAAAAAAGEEGQPASRHGSVARPPATPSRHSRLLSGSSFLNHHIRSTPGRPGQGGRLAGGSGAIAAAATPGGVGWSSVHRGIGSRHSTTAAAAGGGSETWVQEVAGAQAVEGLPWILNTDQVLNHLLEELEGIKAMSGEEKEEGSIAETAAFIEWSHRTGELQELPPLETVDMPGERAFTEGCLKTKHASQPVALGVHPSVFLIASAFLPVLSAPSQLLSAHAAAVLRKEPEQLTAREEVRMAYAIGGGTYTIERLSAHLDALGAGLPTE
ncbi:unnamed protein product [Ectocarpus sp. CCAP 1310/34]|nr:unnamed protein product [Ectocarpus sp. CCAP 1310/34]